MVSGFRPERLAASGTVILTLSPMSLHATTSVLGARLSGSRQDVDFVACEGWIPRASGRVEAERLSDEHAFERIPVVCRQSSGRSPSAPVMGS
jgi:hypothetical protein